MIHHASGPYAEGVHRGSCKPHFSADCVFETELSDGLSMMDYPASMQLTSVAFIQVVSGTKLKLPIIYAVVHGSSLLNFLR